MSQIISEPGKFEGEPEWLPKVWEWMMESGEDEVIYDNDTPTSVFILDKELRELIGDDCDEMDYALCVWESEQGFVYKEFVSEQRLESFRSECSEDIDD